MKAHVSARLGWLLAATVACGAPRAALAQDGPVKLGGSLRAALWSHSRMLDGAGPVGSAALWLDGVVRLGADTSVVAGGFAVAQRVSMDDGGGRRTDDGQLRELFWKTRMGPLDLRVGRQVIVWGRADALNPTDSIGRRDYTRLATDDADQRDGADAVLASYEMGPDYRLQAVWLARFRGDIIPLGQQPMQTISFVAPERRRQYALKFDHSGSVDWSLSYFDGIDRMPDLSLAGVGADGVALRLTHHPVRVLGADFSTSVGEQVWRGEIGWSERSRDQAQAGFFRKRSQLLLVLGGERNVGETGNVNVQLFAQHVPGYRDPAELGGPLLSAVATLQDAINNQGVRRQYGLTWRLARSWMNDTWQGEVSGMGSWTTHATYVRAQLRHAIDDWWRVNLGADRYRGPQDTLFGVLRRNSTAWVEVRRVF